MVNKGVKEEGNDGSRHDRKGSMRVKERAK